MQIENQGQIKSVSLPAGWSEQPAVAEPISLVSIRRFAESDDAPLQVRFVQRRTRHHEAVARRFRQCLDAAPHVLSAEERQAVLPIMGQLADARWFELTQASTLEVQGKCVLWVEGRWKEDPYWSGTLFIDSDDTGRQVEELVFVADLAIYEQNQQLFRDILSSIEWVA